MSSQQHELFIRMARPSDTAECHAIDIEAWGEESAASEEMLQSRIARYPFGNFVAIDRITGMILGSGWSVSTVEKPIKTWWESSGQGEYRDVCDVYGDTVFAVNLSVRREASGRGVGQALIVRIAEAAWAAGKRRAITGVRIPEYHKWKELFRPEDYVMLLIDRDSGVYFRNPTSGTTHRGPSRDELRNKEGPIDPRMWPQGEPLPDAWPFDGEQGYFIRTSVAGHTGKVYGHIPEYFTDPESLNNAALIGWENPDHPDFMRRP